MAGDVRNAILAAALLLAACGTPRTYEYHRDEYEGFAWVREKEKPFTAEERDQDFAVCNRRGGNSPVQETIVQACMGRRGWLWQPKKK